MKKLYKIFLLIITFVFLSTYTPSNFSLIKKEDNNFLQVQKIVIKNNYLIPASLIKEKLNNIYDKNIFLVKKENIEEPLKNIIFLDKIEVRKSYPNKIIIKVFETTPVAILYENKTKYLFDSSSNLITFENYENFQKLPSVFGEGAKDHFIFFLNLLKKNNFNVKEVKKFYFFQIERWDLQLLNDKIIKFPHNGVEAAIKKSIELLDRKDFKNYNIIDLRVDGKIIVE